MRTLKISPIPSNSRVNRYVHQDVLVTGEPINLSLKSLLSASTVLVELKMTGELTLRKSNSEIPLPQKKSLSPEDLSAPLILQANTYSEKLNDRTLDISLLDGEDRIIATYNLSFTVLQICLDVDADRDGVVEENNPHKADWKAGKNGYGAILLVNSDLDVDSSYRESNYEDSRLNGLLDIRDCSLMVVRQVGPKDLPSGCELIIWVSPKNSNYVRIFDELDSGSHELVGPGRKEGRLRKRDTYKDLFLAAEGLHYRDRNFDGEIFVNLSLVKDDETLYTDRVRFEVAPWIMTPNTLSPKTVYILRTSSGSNRDLIEDLRQVVGEANVQLEVVPPLPYRSDRWMQDEIEIGYSESPGHFMYVVLDSPRDRGLDDFAEEELLGTDFGHVTRLNKDATTLDSFGNLEVSPPVTFNGVNYPFGRILFGGDHPNAPQYSMKMAKTVRDFLYGQKIQSPVELFSDWLDVGHIDEFMTFVPVKTGKGFKLIMANTDKYYEVLRTLENQDQGNLRLRSRQGKITVSELLKDEELKQDNARFQTYINWNRDILKKELGLTEEDIIDLPGLYQAAGNKKRAETFSPNMVNMLVLNQHLAIPKPFGPKIKGECQLELFVRKSLEWLGFTCHFIDDWEPYFLGRGEIHCGTNARRKPFSQKWWEV
ncbi:protein-arginine deiminase family protein [Aphanothece sacrum]|uniref:Protein-arginine deiminase n=1 Tax=Aphanothece sacrum FPU1 TaxID=1920663 RepID=A0A401IGK8_APHSA|nr:protein-arginine deiminase family protein [Aphanothece sacrum]GBF80361.1 protein-arginine deiminase [Aphanothece sacrum FPU1]GBF83768.1 protein-arginine deiminase [Aphanothece sacrum FPU3]